MSRNALPTDRGRLVVAVVPARGGSKGVPRKNLREIGGESLLARAVRAGHEAALVDVVVVSTDNDVIADAAVAAGAQLVVRRPAELAEDTTPMISVLRHALMEVRAGFGEPEALVLLQPTSPFRTGAHVDAAVARLRETDAGTVVSVQRVPHQFTPGSVLVMRDGVLSPLSEQQPATRRQDKPEFYARNGPAVLVLRPQMVDRSELYGTPIVGLEMAAFASLDVDGPEDLLLAEALAAAGLVDGVE